MNRLYDTETNRVLFLGEGWTYPFQYNSTGGVETSYCTMGDYKLIKESIKLILGVRAGQRWMLRNFGCNLMKYVFEPLNDMTAIGVKSTVSDALSRWEPRIALDGDGFGVTVQMVQHKKQLIIDTTYRVLRANTMQNLVLLADWDKKRIIEQLNAT